MANRLENEVVLILRPDQSLLQEGQARFVAILAHGEEWRFSTGNERAVGIVNIYTWTLDLKSQGGPASMGLVMAVNGAEGSHLCWNDFLGCASPSDQGRLIQTLQVWKGGSTASIQGLVLTGPEGDWVGSLDGVPLEHGGPVVNLLFRIQLIEAGLAVSSRSRFNLAEVALETAGAGAWEFDLKTQKLYWTDQVFRLHGVTPEDYQPDMGTVSLFYQGTSRTLFEEALLQCSTESKPFDCRVECLTGGRQVRRLRVTGRSIHQSAEINKMAGAYLEVTGQSGPQVAQEGDQLSKVIEKNRTLLKTIPDICLVVDRDGTIMDFSAPDPRQWLATAEQLVGRSVREALPQHAEAFLREIQIALETGKPRQFEYSALNMRGKEVRFEARLLAAEGVQKSGYVVILNRDITERHLHELELRRSREDALQASMVKSQFLANMSHEIRTPLNGVIGMTELALTTELSAEQRDYLDTSLQSARSLLDIINDILDLSKIEAGRLQLESIPFNLRAVVRDTLSSLAVRSFSKGVELLGYVQPDVPQLVVGDPLRFRQLLTNLIGNAIKFTEQGEIEVEIASRDPGVVRVSVYDTGPGIAVERQASIFEPFVQADGSTTRQFGGTGLGLTICRQLVDLMGGSIWLESQVGKGSRFSFTLKLPRYQLDSDYSPMANMARDLGIPRATLDARCGERLLGRRILIVDDNASCRRVLRDLVAGWGMEPITALGPGPALHSIRENARRRRPVELAIIDQVMPGCDGLELAHELPTEMPKILLVTLQRPTPQELSEANIHNVVSKPVWGGELAELFAQIFGDVQQPAQPDPIDLEQTPAPAPSLNILLAEDNPVNAKVMLRMLGAMGHQVVHVVNGSLVLEQMAQRTFDMILMDVQMPVMDGYESTRRVRKHEVMSGEHIPIVALTANAMTGDRERCIESGMDNYLTKPIEKERLSQVLRELSTQKRNHSAPRLSS